MELNNIVNQFINATNYHTFSVANGLINSTYILENNDKDEKFILQKINTQVFKNPGSIVNNHLEINLLLHKSDYKLQVVEPIASLHNDFVVKDENGCFWRMLSYIQSSITFLKVPDKETAFRAAKTFSYFLNTINEGELPKLEITLPDFLNFEKRISDYKNSLKNADPILIKNAENEIDYADQLLSLPEKWITMVNTGMLPPRIIHADAKISNILFSENKIPIAVIDLDTVMLSTILYDFGTMIQSYTNKTNEDDGKAKNNFDAEIYEAVKDGFLFHLKEKLTPEESENLDYAGQAAIYIQMIRFLSDYLNGSIYYSVQYPEHNLDRTKNQIQLLKGLMEYLRICP
ncbi:Phosphotransferase enzyme family protein [Chryseobacterium sp. RU37D]|uniref:phosphotransferase enzyme family protein n=1 Tax=Chryseobacterium sp. RU37D TaxID=1907397 RepID=UPI000956DCDC|nr:aminoglycoside phosphotransferase family protein [Chryseobacterium sp. RU37D]SIQ59069.1 Phosphotransferase enzyme family protein [Chryseobacterium sp. RU37D]